MNLIAGKVRQTMWSEGRTVKGECCMADLEHARSMLRVAHKDFNALVGMQEELLSVEP